MTPEATSFISLGNWRHQALKQISRRSKELARESWRQPDVATMYRAFEKDLTRATRIRLPDSMGQWFEISPILDMAIDRLPFETVVFEYHCPTPGPTGDTFVNGQRVESSECVERRLIIAKQLERSISLSFVWRCGSVWAPVHFGAEIATKPIELLSAEHLRRERHFDSSGKEILPRKTNIFATATVFSATLAREANRLMIAAGLDPHLQWGNDVQEECHVVAVFLTLLGCRNVSLSRSERKPKTSSVMGQARVDRDTFYELSIDTDPVEQQEPQNYDSDTIRQRPREHVRRGHIYHTKNGVRLWRQGCVVNPGIGHRIEHDYRLKVDA